MKFHNIKEQLDNIKLLQDSINEDLRTIKIDMLDEQVTGILLNTEKGYRKLRIDEVEYSLEVSKAIETQCIQRIALKVAKNDIEYRKELVKISEKNKINMGDLGNIQTVKVKIDQSRKAYL